MFRLPICRCLDPGAVTGMAGFRIGATGSIRITFFGKKSQHRIEYFPATRFIEITQYFALRVWHSVCSQIKAEISEIAHAYIMYVSVFPKFLTQIWLHTECQSKADFSSRPSRTIRTLRPSQKNPPCLWTARDGDVLSNLEITRCLALRV
ncbi:MAG: hypothetical protein ACI822_003125 [Gammaproteobacteria bacterium]|jgi:hypothetical protein